MKFEIGKCYEYTSGVKMRIVGELDTYTYGNCLIGETDDGIFLPAGHEEPNTINWKECEDFANGE